MLLAENIVQQAELLFAQRLLLNSNRYIGLVQLTQHDQRLLDCLQLLQSTAGAGEDAGQPGWLSWLTSADNSGLFQPEQLQQFTAPAQAWLLLHQLKFQQQSGVVSRWMEQSLTGDTPDNELVWLWAARQRLMLTPVLQRLLQTGQVTAPMLHYLATNGQRTMLPMLQQFIKQRYSLSVNNDKVQSAALFAAYVLGQQSDEAELATRLRQSEQLTDTALMLLMIAASDTMQARIINDLSALDITTAVQAMAYSGQLKFVPLLLELAQQADSKEIAADALAILLGVLDADASIAAGTGAVIKVQKGHRTLAGFTVGPQQMAIIWRQGNQAQRQLVACHRFLATPGTALVFTDVLLGAPVYA